MTSVYAGFNQEELDAEYNPRLKVDFRAIASRWAAASTAVRANARGQFDLAYGPTPSERLDVYLATGTQRPIHIFFHGGYWRSMDKKDFAFLTPGFLDSDSVCVIVNYALCPSVTIEEIVRQCRAATAWVWRNCASIGGDPEKITVSGHSAGGHIVAMLLQTDWVEQGLPSDFIRSAVALSGLFDLEPLRLSFLNAEIRLTSESAYAMSPINFIRPTSCPLLVCAGGAESPEFHRQSKIFADAWKRIGNSCVGDPALELDHYTIMEAAYDPRTPLGAHLFSHIGV